jgi:hypothetical protein
MKGRAQADGEQRACGLAPREVGCFFFEVLTVEKYFENHIKPNRGTSLIRNNLPPGPYSRAMPFSLFLSLPVSLCVPLGLPPTTLASHTMPLHTCREKAFRARLGA